ncbi:response regulator transcription factor [Humibacter ginsenosidimutans]|uniref:Response regulator transcription factor n=2 Tax=Humibacter ginsenosidimutans TaxID=2599293 RepID=A0A5B8M9D6_9MICO|nr:response regulator transcription factor [Humibacter ginsenosidimutans]
MARLLRRGLDAEGYDVIAVDNGVDALIALRDHPVDAMAVDVMLPGMSGFELCRRVRESGRTMPILLLTARDAVEDRVFGLDSGADDYLTKPFAFAELAARLRALLRRDASGKPTLRVGKLTIDSLEHKASVDGKQVAFSPREFSLVRLLATHAGEMVTRSDILDDIWGGHEHIDQNVLDQYVSYVRRKLDASATGIRITTVRGLGYRLEPVEAHDAAAEAEPSAEQRR